MPQSRPAHMSQFSATWQVSSFKSARSQSSSATAVSAAAEQPTAFLLACRNTRDRHNGGQHHSTCSAKLNHVRLPRALAPGPTLLRLRSRLCSGSRDCRRPFYRRWFHHARHPRHLSRTLRSDLPLPPFARKVVSSRGRASDWPTASIHTDNRDATSRSRKTASSTRAAQSLRKLWALACAIK